MLLVGVGPQLYFLAMGVVTQAWGSALENLQNIVPILMFSVFLVALIFAIYNQANFLATLASVAATLIVFCAIYWGVTFTAPVII